MHIYEWTMPKTKVKRCNKTYFSFTTTAPSFFIQNVCSRDDWAYACCWSIEKLPKLPIPFSASQHAKTMDVSHVTAKKRMLRDHYNFYQLTTKHFLKVADIINIPIHLWDVIRKCSTPIQLISAINELRRFGYEHEPSKKNIVSFLMHPSFFQILIKEKVLRRVLLLGTSNKYFYFVPKFLVRRYRRGQTE